MGSCVSQDFQHQLSKTISNDIHTDQRKTFIEKKILFLGSGGSGKSTLFKQLRLIHGRGFSDVDREGYIKHIHTQIINQMKSIIRVYIDYHHRKEQQNTSNESGDDSKVDDDLDDELLKYDNLTLESPPIQDMKAAELILDCEYGQDIVTAIRSLWSEAVVKEIYNLRHITNIETSSAHFWDKIDDIMDSSYLPSTEDILLNRVVTTALHEQQFEVKGGRLHIIDVGGQRSQRRKWIHCFEHVVAVIFIASLSCYDSLLDEDAKTNAMEDQLELFDEIINDPILSKVSMILFLNKTDLFKQKYCKKKIALNKCERFRKFKDEYWDYNKATIYILSRFEKISRSKSGNIFSHFTCATDTRNIEKVFADVREIVISGNLCAAGMLDDQWG